jgi:hypothetical protein
MVVVRSGDPHSHIGNLQVSGPGSLLARTAGRGAPLHGTTPTHLRDQPDGRGPPTRTVRGHPLDPARPFLPDQGPTGGTLGRLSARLNRPGAKFEKPVRISGRIELLETSCIGTHSSKIPGRARALTPVPQPRGRRRGERHLPAVGRRSRRGPRARSRAHGGHEFKHGRADTGTETEHVQWPGWARVGEDLLAHQLRTGYGFVGRGGSSSVSGSERASP